MAMLREVGVGHPHQVVEPCQVRIGLRWSNAPIVMLEEHIHPSPEISMERAKVILKVVANRFCDEVEQHRHRCRASSVPLEAEVFRPLNHGAV